MPEKSPIVEIAKKVCPAVITIVISKDLPKVEGFYYLPFGDQNVLVPRLDKGKREKMKVGGGSGFIVSPDGYILTSQHVISDPEAEYAIIVDPTKRFVGRVLARDPINDIAILKIDGENLPFLDLGDSDRIEIGESVIAVGNPLGEFHDTISAGIISGLSRFITAYGSLSQETARLKGLIQTDAAINPGNSGGPLVDMEGKVIGVNTAMVAGAQNLGFAIPINYAKNDLDEVKRYGKITRPFLGVKYIILNKEIAEQNRLPIAYGALTLRERLGEEAIVKGSAADKVGIKEYDIIMEINDEKITEKNPLANILQKFKIGNSVNLKILRAGKEIAIDVVLEEKK